MKKFSSPEKIENSLQEKEMELRKIWKEIMSKKPMGFYEKIKPLENEIKKDFPNFIDYRLFYVLVGSNVEPDWECPHFDFPGKYSVESFIREAALELLGKKTV